MPFLQNYTPLLVNYYVATFCRAYREANIDEIRSKSGSISHRNTRVLRGTCLGERETNKL